MPAALQAPAAILLLGGGLVTCFFGHRLFRVVLGIYGFILGAVLANSLMGAAESTSLIVAMVAGGLVGGAILIVAYFIGVALIGAALGALLLRIIWTQIGSDPDVMIVVAASLIGALGALALQRYIIIVGTALGGAWSALGGGVALFGAPWFAAPSGQLYDWLIYPMRTSSESAAVLAAWFVLGLLGVVVQFGVTAKR